MLRTLFVLAVVVVLAGCGKDPISHEAAEKIASLSQDSEKHLSGFTNAIQRLSEKEDCDSDFMHDYGGFSKVTGKSYYFIYCGEPVNISRRWYFDSSSQKLTRFDAEI